jgi:hypothetical protein
MALTLVLLQAVQVAFLWLHDWVPLAPLNDVSAVRRENTTGSLIRTTVIQSLPFTIGLGFSIADLRSGYPPWLWIWLYISYGLLLGGELRAWWLPYMLRAEPARAARYRAMFGTTHAFLPERDGMVPNTLHCLLHLATLATVIVLTYLSA